MTLPLPPWPRVEIMVAWRKWRSIFSSERLSARHIQPVGHDAFDFVWTHFGFADDTPEMTQRRLRQANLFGPAGFVSADDGEVIEFSQSGFAQKPWHRSVAELGGKTAENPTTW